MRKKRIFIGSSNESKELAGEIKKKLEDTYDYFECDVWYDDFFPTGSYTYNELITRSISYDYAVFIGNGDDQVLRLSTKQTRISPRDNVYIEYSLFNVVLSKNNVLFLLDDVCTKASDLEGMTIEKYKDRESALQICADWFKTRETKDRYLRKKEVELLPTVGIAIGYYMNFVDKVGSSLQEKKTVILNDEEYQYNSADIEIYIPDYYDETFENYWSAFENLHSNFTSLRSNHVNARINNYRILVDPEKLKQGKLVIYDIPSTLIAVFKTVDFIINEENTCDRRFAKCRALDNFAVVLTDKAEQNPGVNKYIHLLRLSLD